MSKFGNRGRHKGGGGKGYKVGDQAKATLEGIDENSAVIKCFREYARKLDEKHDKFERLVKLSRDITIESKRIIFLLHSMNKESKRTAVLEEAETRLESLVSKNWKSVAKELHKEDPYLYRRAFSAGMQEFIEAYAFFNYLKDKQILHWDHYQEKLKYVIPKESDNTIPEQPQSEDSIETSALIIPSDFILGLADVTGELMRKCINSLGEGDTQSCFETCNFVRSIHAGFLTLDVSDIKEMSNKAYTLRHSLLKMENVCYNIHVRGSEVFKFMLVDVNPEKRSETYEEDDKGFFE